MIVRATLIPPTVQVKLNLEITMMPGAAGIYVHLSGYSTIGPVFSNGLPLLRFGVSEYGFVMVLAKNIVYSGHRNRKAG